MISEVPLGAFLSGGVDSSAVVATMAGLSDGPVNTCSIAFDDPAFDESALRADRWPTATAPATSSSASRPTTSTSSTRWPRLYDEPYADSSAIPTYRVCQLARKHVTVALSGDGGDESFGGYRRYRLHLMRRAHALGAAAAGVRQPLFGLLGRVYPKADWAPRVPARQDHLRGLARNSVEAYFHSMSILRDAMRAQLFSDALQARARRLPRSEVFDDHAARAGTDDPLALIQYLDLKTYLVGDINTKVDRASMAHSLEVREPLMDHELVEWLATLPSTLKVRGGEGKFLLKKAMEPQLPRRRAVPAEDGLRGAAGALVPRAAEAARARRGARASGWPHRLVQSRLPAAPGRRAPESARATTARRCGRC